MRGPLRAADADSSKLVGVDVTSTHARLGPMRAVTHGVAHRWPAGGVWVVGVAVAVLVSGVSGHRVGVTLLRAGGGAHRQDHQLLTPLRFALERTLASRGARRLRAAGKGGGPVALSKDVCPTCLLGWSGADLAKLDALERDFWRAVGAVGDGLAALFAMPRSRRQWRGGGVWIFRNIQSTRDVLGVTKYFAKR